MFKIVGKKQGKIKKGGSFAVPPGSDLNKIRQQILSRLSINIKDRINKGGSL